MAVDAGADAGIAVDAGLPVDSGVIDAGPSADAGVNCATVAYSATLGTLVLVAPAVASVVVPLPNDIVSVGIRNDNEIYGLHSDSSLRFLGALNNLSVGPKLTNVVTPADVDAGAMVFLGSAITVSGREILAQYTKSAAGSPGSVAIYNTQDAGTRYVNAPGNFTSAASADGFVINGLGLESLTGAGVYALDKQGAFLLAEFDSTWKAASGFTAHTANDVFLLGYFDGTTFENVVRAAPSALTALAFQNRTSFMLAQAPVVVSADDIADVTSFGNDAVVVHGGYTGAPDFAPYTTRVDRIPLTLVNQVVTAQPAVTLVKAPNICTKVLFAQGNGSTLLLGIEDKNGRRLVKLSTP
jgi:hypothetical protein